MLAVSAALTIAAAAVDLPLHPDDAKIVSAIADTEEMEIELAEPPSFARSGLLKNLEEIGLDPKTITVTGIGSTTKKPVRLAIAADKDGRIVAFSGNGPWFRNETLRSLKGLPELRLLHIDHNGFVGSGPESEAFDGTGFDALADSKLTSIKIGLSFDDDGMRECAKIQGLTRFACGHARITNEGIAAFAGHPNLVAFSVSEMARPEVDDDALATFATLPKLREAGLKECIVAYQGGLDHLAPLAGRLEVIDLTMSLVTPADMAKLKADHPDAEIVTLPISEIPKRHIHVARRLAQQAPPELAKELQAAIARSAKK